MNSTVSYELHLHWSHDLQLLTICKSNQGSDLCNSTRGYVFFGTNLVSHTSKKQNIVVSHSCIEVENRFYNKKFESFIFLFNFK
ncbi:hypothetical protein CR513_19692, partial [Mucuna pruriens]